MNIFFSLIVRDKITLFYLTKRDLCPQLLLTLTGATTTGAESQGREVRDTGAYVELMDVGHTWESIRGPDGDRGRMRGS